MWQCCAFGSLIFSFFFPSNGIGLFRCVFISTGLFLNRTFCFSPSNNLEKVNLSRFILPTVIEKKNCVRKEHYQSLHIVGKINWLINSNNAALFLLGDYLCCMTIKEYIWKRNCDSMDSFWRILTDLLQGILEWLLEYNKGMEMTILV